MLGETTFWIMSTFLYIEHFTIPDEIFSPESFQI